MRLWVYTNNFICVLQFEEICRNIWYTYVIIYRSNHLATRAMWNGSRAEQDDLGFAEWVHRLEVKYVYAYCSVGFLLSWTQCCSVQWWTFHLVTITWWQQRWWYDWDWIRSMTRASSQTWLCCMALMWSYNGTLACVLASQIVIA